MATRYLWVDVARRQISAVILAVDDRDPEWREVFHAQNGLLKANPAPHLEAAAEKTLSAMDWEVDVGGWLETDGWKEIPEAEARHYPCYTVPTTLPEERLVSTETAERRAALEAVGQGVLLEGE